jgi:hypothetical protein
MNTHSLWEMKQAVIEKGPSGEWVVIPAHPVICGMTMWDVAWLREIGGLQEPTDLYGHLECHMWKHLDQATRRWVFALNSIEGWKDLMPGLEDDWYIEHKRQHAHHGDRRTLRQFYEDAQK